MNGSRSEFFEGPAVNISLSLPRGSHGELSQGPPLLCVWVSGHKNNLSFRSPFSHLSGNKEENWTLSCRAQLCSGIQLQPAFPFLKPRSSLLSQGCAPEVTHVKRVTEVM